MHSSENARRSQRRRPDLNISTSGSKSLTRDSLPQTPTNRKPPPSRGNLKAPGTGSRALKVPSHTARDAAEVETFLDMLTPVDMSANKENDRPFPAVEPHRPNHRDSHDLSLPSRHVRDSLVSNMLLSLDQFSMGQMSGPSRATFEDPLYSLTGGEDMTRTMTANSRTSRLNGHGYSYSSDYEAPDDASRVSSNFSRGRRSNSSSGFQSSLVRINSMRESLYRSSQPGTPRLLHSRGGRGSTKSSSTNSIDAGYAQVLSSQRWAHGFGGRSSSFDYGQRPSTSSQPPWHIEFSNTFFSDGYDDAAPTPTVPGGPRRLATVPSMPIMPSYQPPPDPLPEPRSPSRGPERKRSVRSSRSATVSRQAQSKFSMSRQDAPAFAATFDLDSAPAPHVGYEKQKEAVHDGPMVVPQQPAPQQTREKPGFFRRVFGSLRDAAFDSSNSHPNNSAFVSSTSVESAGSRGQQQQPQQHIVTQMKSQSTPPSRDSSHHSHGTLQKKPSSFFRRRKKSVTEAESPPPLPAPLVAPPQPPPPPSPLPAVPPIKLPPATKSESLVPKPQPSPITSLRRAMDPYLKNSPTTPGASTLDAPTPSSLSSPSLPLAVDDDILPSTPQPRGDREQKAGARRSARGFSPDYEPPPSATIRSVSPDAKATQDITSSGGEGQQKDTPSRPPLQPVRTGSFLSDNSDSEDSPKRLATKASGRRLTQKASIEGDRNTPSPAVSKPLLSPVDDVTLSRLDRRGVVNPDAEDDSRASRLLLPIEGVAAPPRSAALSTDTILPSSLSVPRVNVDGPDHSGSERGGKTRDALKGSSLDEPEFIIGEPTEDDRLKAQKIFDGNEDFIQREKAASWMGEEGTVRQRTLRAYMDLYDFRNQSVVTSLRDVCSRLILRAETQQVDRILVAFSRRWCECNPNHGFKSIDVIHTMCYSIMLLNTDLHVADIEQKMTRGQFIKNTMTTIKQALSESAPEVFGRPSVLPSKSQTLNVEGDGRHSGEQDRTTSFRNSILTPLRSESSMGHRNDDDDCGPLVKAPFDGPIRAWEAQVELVLKDTYASIRDERLPLFGAEATNQLHSQSSLSVIGMLKRTPSVLSKTPSEGQTSTRGRITETARSSTSRWASKSRSRPRLANGGFSSSRTSFDDGNSVWSPTTSSATWSRQSLGRTQTSASVDSLNSSWAQGDYQQSIGFANALSQAIVREDALGSSQSLVSDENSKERPLLDDESLELAGPPWVKEGIVTHKHHLDGIDKKAKDRNWTEVFAVVQKGYMSLFSFSPNKSMRSKGRNRQNVPKGAVVGGGNWQENATNLATFSLKQTLASALPPPGYSRQRPHVWALSLPTGAVHLFQVGTPEISKEFVTSVNYWSARLSTHPLVGGISNIEYGWSDAIVNNSLVSAINESNPVPPGTRGSGSRPGSAAAAAGRSSIQSRGSFRSGSFDFGHVRTGSSSGGPGGGPGVGPGVGGAGSGGRHGKLPGDRIHIADWTPPTQSLRPSNASETEQLQTLLAYVRAIEDELQVHNALRSPMLLAFTPRGHNAVRAMANWEKKSAYLLREIVKFRTYVDCLAEAERRRTEIYKEREVARRAARGEISGSLGSADDFAAEFGMRKGVDGDEEGDMGDDTLRA